LLVEDQLIILENMRQELEDESFDVLTASSAEEARAIIDFPGQRIDAAFLDIDLGPGENGFCVARHARDVMPDLPVIYTSGGIRGGLVSEQVKDSLFVAKPYYPSQIGALIKTILSVKSH
jgi:DNA-binding NtrC family response regulator